MRRGILRWYGVVPVCLAVVLVLAAAADLQGEGTSAQIFWDSPIGFICIALIPVFGVMLYRRAGPRPPMTTEDAETLLPPGPPCGRCHEIPVVGMSVCPVCGNLLRPWAIIIPGALIVAAGLLVVLYRHGAFTS